MISEEVKKYCIDDISLIENYEQAINDDTQIWDCHHRAEILPCGNFTRDALKKFGLYFHRPASELVFLPHSEHQRLHRLGKHWSEEYKRKMSAVLKGRPSPLKGRPSPNKGNKYSEETKRKMSLAKKGKPKSEETKIKMRKPKSEETKRKMSLAKKGKKREPFSDETRRKMSESHKARWAKRNNAENGI